MFRDGKSFYGPNIDSDISRLRYKHYISRLLDTVRRILEERQKVILGLNRAHARNRSPLFETLQQHS